VPAHLDCGPIARLAAPARSRPDRLARCRYRAPRAAPGSVRQRQLLVPSFHPPCPSTAGRSPSTTTRVRAGRCAIGPTPSSTACSTRARRSSPARSKPPASTDLPPSLASARSVPRDLGKTRIADSLIQRATGWGVIGVGDARGTWCARSKSARSSANFVSACSLALATASARVTSPSRYSCTRL
jgi:hypothetical protein